MVEKDESYLNWISVALLINSSKGKCRTNLLFLRHLHKTFISFLKVAISQVPPE